MYKKSYELAQKYQDEGLLCLCSSQTNDDLTNYEQGIEVYRNSVRRYLHDD